MARRQHLVLVVILAIVALLGITYIHSASLVPRPADLFKPDRSEDVPSTAGGEEEPPASTGSKSGTGFDLGAVPDLSKGDSIAPPLENATKKSVSPAAPCLAELGRATWKFLHTMVARFPEKPTDSERKTLESFFHVFGLLYPCGDCARHFRGLLQKYPPQTSSRNAAQGWLCAVHNHVNKRLNTDGQHPQFDCTKIGDAYDCGCGDDKKDTDEGEEDGKKSKVTRAERGHVAAPWPWKQWTKAIEGL
ncbi:ERV2 protein-like protein [Metarhizium album ARSEF 1941]|uniref:Sulfhydryl oxidase n=1 Tax=Metarhizium album (strain ARSEF 1941) TaxID=1081103 RepID=A0A0B2WWJ9_METAS|nr:ERV2 protein-like protein [Metarhizium album ARSEF 1941]KHO00597.1 ERV2 protein-like protein [Metarhizium album ARSEF 1941]